MDDSLLEMKDQSLIMKLMYKVVEGTIARGLGCKKDSDNPEFRMMMAASTGAPLRCLQISGGLRDGLMQGLLELANGHFLKGVRKMLGA